MGIESYPNTSDWVNARDSFFTNLGWLARSCIFHKFKNYATQGAAGIETHRIPQYYSRGEIIWLSNVKVFDTVKGGYFTTGDLDVNTSFQIRGFQAAYTLKNGTVIPEYGGDQVEWNGRLWVPSDQIEPVSLGPKGALLFWRTVLRAVDRSNQGLTAGPT